MTLVCCLAPLNAELVRSWLPAHCTLRMVDTDRGQADVESQCAGADLVIADTLHRVELGASFFAGLAAGAFVQQPSVGFDEVDVVAARDHAVTVANALEEPI